MHRTGTHILAAEGNQPVVTRTTRDGCPPALKGLSVLVADDSTVIRTIVGLLLEKMGHRVATAASGDEAFTVSMTRRFDVILMDVQMPAMDGMEATRRIRASASVSRETPILALTANLANDKTSDCLAAGMTACVSKPVDRWKLEQALDRALKSIND